MRHGAWVKTARDIGWVGLMLSTVAWATTFRPTTIDALIRRADAIVVGRVISSTSSWTGDGQRIITETVLEVAETLWGVAGGQVRVVQPGGIVGDIGQDVHGAATFSQGERVVVLLSTFGSKRYQVTGMAQGKFSVASESATARLLQGDANGIGEALTLNGLRSLVARRAPQTSPPPAPDSPPPPTQVTK